MQEAKHALPADQNETPEAQVHPTGVLLPDSEIQHPTGAVTEEDKLPGDDQPQEEKHELGEQTPPEDVPNGGE